MRNFGTLCGIECEFSDLREEWGFFKFPGINFGSHYFAVIDYTVVCQGKMTELPSEFSQDYFCELIRMGFVCDHLVLHLYPVGVSVQEIDDYNEYVKSQCEMIVLAYDGALLEIYCKNHEWLHAMMDTAKQLPGVNVCEKYVETDTRTVMYV